MDCADTSGNRSLGDNIPLRNSTSGPNMTALGLIQPFDPNNSSSASPSFQYRSSTDLSLHPCDPQQHLQHLHAKLDQPSAPPSLEDFILPDLSDQDFPLFPSSFRSSLAHNQSSHLDEPMFNNAADMTASQTHQHFPDPPHLLSDSQRQSSPSLVATFIHQRSPYIPPAHSRQSSLGPEAAFLPGQLADWNQPQYQSHRQSLSDYSDVTSALHSPHLLPDDCFDLDAPSHRSPLQQPIDHGMVMGIGNFTLADRRSASPIMISRTPSHSPGVSPRLLPQSVPDNMTPPAPSHYGLGLSNGYSASSSVYSHLTPGTSEAFPAFQTMAHMQLPLGSNTTLIAPPAINIDFAPTNSRPNPFEPSNPLPDQGSLSPPERGRPQIRARADTDPYRRSKSNNHLSPHMDPDMLSRSENSSRSVSPLTKANNLQIKRRGSVPNAMVRRLNDPEYQDVGENGKLLRGQKNPATFQCSLCPKRFTRAYNLRSHLRTHTDERPFVCTVCTKAFARQHDRKRHESLHSGEKRFVCKGELKSGFSWGCGKRFHRADALSRHLRSETGRLCVKPLLEEEILERQHHWQESHLQELSQAAHPDAMGLDVNPYQLDLNDSFTLPAALIAQYPALAHVNWAEESHGGLDDEISGRSSFDASDFEEGDDGGYASGSGHGYGDGSMNPYGEMAYSSEYGAP